MLEEKPSQPNWHFHRTHGAVFTAPGDMTFALSAPSLIAMASSFRTESCGTDLALAGFLTFMCDPLSYPAGSQPGTAPPRPMRHTPFYSGRSDGETHQVIAGTAPYCMRSSGLNLVTGYNAVDNMESPDPGHTPRQPDPGTAPADGTERKVATADFPPTMPYEHDQQYMSEPTAPGPGAEPPRLAVWKKLLFSLAAVCLFFLACELILYACGVRPQAYSEDPFVGFSSFLPLFEEKTENGKTFCVTAANKLRWFNPQRFPKDKPAGTYRIFCMGGSTTYGHPYTDSVSFTAWLREMLPATDPSRNWELINAGGISYASYRVAALMEELNRYKPDLYIIYSGHNEFLERRTYAEIFDRPKFLVDLSAVLSRTRTYTALRRAYVRISGQSAQTDPRGRTVLGGEVKAILDMAAGLSLYTRDDKLAGQVVTHYRENLRRMVDIARAAGAKVIFVTPAANLKDTHPFKSEHRSGLNEAERMRWQELYSLADNAAKAGRSAEALELLQRAAAIDDRYAELHYRMGRILYDLQDYARAKTAFVRAMDEDICPLRALSTMQRIVAEVAAERNVALVDFTALVESRSGHGIPGEEMFFDHVHPRQDANRDLVLAILKQMADEKIARPAPTWNDAAVERVSAVMKSRITTEAQVTALLNLSKTLGWAGKYEESGRLARQVLALDADNPEANYNLAVALQREGKNAAAEKCYRAAAADKPDYAEAYSGLANVLLLLNKPQEALECVQKAIRIKPDHAESHFGAGEILARVGRTDDAMGHYRKALDLDGDLAPAHASLGRLLWLTGRTDQALTHLEKAVTLNPNDAVSRAILGNILAAQGRFEEALLHFHWSVAIDPTNVAVVNNLAWLLATSPRENLRDPARAIRLAERASAATGNKEPGMLDTLAAAYAAAGQFPKAIETAQKAVDLAKTTGQDKLAGEIQGRLDLYRQGRPYRERQ
jgi:tetratricopeptide (TPR) repeat protein